MASQNNDDITDINDSADDGLNDNVDDGLNDSVDDGPDDLADDGPDDSADDPDDLADDPDDPADDPDDLEDDGPDDIADDGPDDSADDPDDGPDDGFNNLADDGANASGNDGANDIVSSTISSSIQSPTPTSLVNSADAESAPGLVNAAAADAAASTGQSKTSIKIIGGIVAALVGILIIFSVAIFYLKRRGKAKEKKDAHRGIIFDAKAQRDEEEGGGEGTSFIGEKKSHSREDSMASTRSKSSTDDYLKSGRKRSSIGTYQSPGVAPQEAYMMFGGSTANLNDDDEEKKPLTYHQRHLSESATASNRHSWSGAPAPTDPRARRISLLDDDSRYPAINGSTDSLGIRPQMRHSVSYPAGVDPFSDATPTGSPKAPSKALTTGDIHGAPPAKPLGARPPPPPGSPSGGRRISLKGGVGVRQARSQSIGPGGSPVASPKSAWK